MRNLARAWTDSGGQVVGLAPSAAAAAQLRATGAPADTLAKLTWSIHHNDPPEWAQRIDPSTLVIIDEAGMADTLSLDTAVQFIISRGGSVRLVGDDQQLAAIGAAGCSATSKPVMAPSGSATTKINYKTRETATFWAARNGQPRHCCRVGAHDPVTSLEQLLAELMSEAAADAS
jgi:ATP-dependent exoDNAse (exonuclease V) alpha subunit